MKTSISKKELKMVVKESVRETLAEELLKFRALLVPSVSQKEQRNIEKSYGLPSRNVEKTMKVDF